MTPRNVGSSLLALLVLLILAAISRASTLTYNTTLGGGSYGRGTIFAAYGRDRMTEYSFCSRAWCLDGADPEGGLVQFPDGTLYGTTARGGDHGGGVLFQFGPVGSPNPGYSVLEDFCLYWQKCTFYGRPRGSLWAVKEHGRMVLEGMVSRENGRAALYRYDPVTREMRVLQWWGKP